jgi:hypothetical protein
MGELKVTRSISKRIFLIQDEDKSITRAFPEGPPCSNTGGRGQQEDTSAGDPGGDGVPDSADEGVLASLAVELPSVEGERSRVMPLLPSIIEKQEQEKETLSKKGMKRRNVIWFPVGNEGGTYSLGGVMPLQ